MQAGPQDVEGAEALLGSSLQPQQGGYSWIVFSTGERPEAEAIAAEVAGLGYRAALYVERSEGAEEGGAAEPSDPPPPDPQRQGEPDLPTQPTLDDKSLQRTVPTVQVTFHVLVGQFGEAEAAEAARAALPRVTAAAAPYLLPLEGKARWLQPARALSRRIDQ